MRIKRYEAQTMQNALQKVKDDLGMDAVILQARDCSRQGLFGLFGRRKVEVTAASDVNLASFEPSGGRKSPGRPSGTFNPYAYHQLETNFEALREELRKLETRVDNFTLQTDPASSPDVPELLAPLYQILVGNEVEEEIAKEIIWKVRERLSSGNAVDTVNRETVEQHALVVVEQFIATSGPLDVGKGQARVVALVGPTGVGKTTTIAKLAAAFSLIDKKRVALVTADTYRVAAIRQLQTYGEILGVPIEVVYSPEEMKSAISKHSGDDLILIDTAGRSPRNPMQIQELKCLMEASDPHEVHLALSATTRYADLLDVLERFGKIRIDRLVLTKLDEGTRFGSLLNLSVKTGKALSYVTTGQNVPEDFEPADARKLARLVLQGGYLS